MQDDLSGGSGVSSAVTPAFPGDSCFPGREWKSLLWADLTSQAPSSPPVCSLHLREQNHSYLHVYSNIPVCSIKTYFLSFYDKVKVHTPRWNSILMCICVLTPLVVSAALTNPVITTCIPTEEACGLEPSHCLRIQSQTGCINPSSSAN